MAVAGNLQDESRIRKVEKFNEAYRLKEKGAVLNWFDITEKEGYLSLNSKFGDIMKTLKGKMLLLSTFAKLMPKGKDSPTAGLDMNSMSGLMDMLGSFTLLRLIGMMGTMNINPTKEQLLDLNAKLNNIKAK